MANRRFTLHWHHIDAPQTEYPGAIIEQRLFIIERDRYTRTGGMAPLDMMQTINAQYHGRRTAKDVADGLVRRSRLPMIEIGQMAGFASPSHLSDAYRARFGVSPKRARAAPHASN